MNNLKFMRVNNEKFELIGDINIDGNTILKKELNEFITDKNNYCFVGIFENVVVAFLYGYGMLRPDGKSMFYIHSVDVISEYQNKGIGTKLMEYVLKYIKNEKKYYKFFVLADDDNIRACKLYQKYANKSIQVLFNSNI